MDNKISFPHIENYYIPIKYIIEKITKCEVIIPSLNNKETIEGDFYLRMQLDEFSFAMLDNQMRILRDEIQVLKNLYKKGMLKF